MLDILGYTLTAVFGATTIYLYCKSRSYKKPVFIYKNTILQTRGHPQVSILFDGKTIKQLSRVTVLFYNNGKREIRSDDIPSSKYPKINFSPEVNILLFKVISFSTPDINFKVSQKGEHSIQLHFDYLNPGDGGVIEILYETGEKDKEVPATFEASIIGGLPVSVLSFDKAKSRAANRRQIIPLIVPAFLIALIPLLSSIDPPWFSSSHINILLISAFVLLFVLPALTQRITHYFLPEYARENL